ncbi:MAG TPA: hypothetical protein VN035_10480 [Microbacterium sp.]|nr:hypothetical protein [Microbacterium sp.]
MPDDAPASSCRVVRDGENATTKVAITNGVDGLAAIAAVRLGR